MNDSSGLEGLCVGTWGCSVRVSPRVPVATGLQGVCLCFPPSSVGLFLDVLLLASTAVCLLTSPDTHLNPGKIVTGFPA